MSKHKIVFIVLVCALIILPTGVSADEVITVTPPESVIESEIVGSESIVVQIVDEKIDVATTSIGISTTTLQTGTATSSGNTLFDESLITLSTEEIAAPVPEIPSPVSIFLDIESATTTLYKGTITVEACSAFPDATSTVSGFCAIKQTGLANEWSVFGDDQFLSSVAGVGNDYVSGQYWGWFSNLEYGQISLNKHLLAPNEELLINIGRMPLRMTASSTSPSVNGTTTVSVSHFGFDQSWNAMWLPAASSTILWGNEHLAVDQNGLLDITISTSTPFELHAEEDGFIPSRSVLITPFAIIEATSTATTTATSTDLDDSNPPIIGGSGSVVTHHTIDVQKAIQFLESKQNTDGSFTSSMYTDWAAIAFAAGPESSGKSKITSYLKNSNETFWSITDYERHAMALMALGINPYDGTSINFIQKITEAFDGTQIGYVELVNDDIFAIFPLMRAGYSTDDQVIQKTVAFIISKQLSNGSWVNSPDMTGAAIQALSLTRSLPGVSSALANAKNYLLSHQENDGGFSSSPSTSWIVQGIAALGESPSAWLKNDKDPNDSLYALQQSDGGLEDLTNIDETRIWATAYGIPAALNKPWGAILKSFTRPVTVVDRGTNLNAGLSASSTQNNSGAASTTATSTASVATSSPQVATSSAFVITSAIPSPRIPILTPLKVVGEEASPTEATSTNDLNVIDPQLLAAAGDSSPPGSGKGIVIGIISSLIIGIGFTLFINKNKHV